MPDRDRDLPAADRSRPTPGDLSAEGRISLQEAADRLGVHYQTAYRWVRAGSLPAEKVRGVYEVSIEELKRFDEERRRPAPPPAARVVRSWGHFTESLRRALMAGDEGTARDLVENLVGGGVHLVDCCDGMIGPALRLIGEAWSTGEISIGEERRASAIVERILGRVTPSPPGRPRGTAVVCSPLGEEHQLPGEMATVVLREDHWRVHHLGVGVPTEDVVGMVRRLGPDLAVVSTVWPPVAAEAEALAASIRPLVPRTLVGTAGRSLADLVAEARPGG